MKGNAILRIVLFSLIVFILVGVLAGAILFDQYRSSGLFGSWNDNNQIQSGNISNSGSVSAGEISKLDVQWLAGSITIRPGDTDEISFSETANHTNPMVWKQNGDKLVIQFCEAKWVPFSGLRISSKRKNLVITVPRAWIADKIQIEAVSANVNVSNLTMKELEIDSVSGVCDLRGCTADKVSVETVSGDVKCTGSLGTLECEAVSADCTVSLNNAPQKISLESVSGDLDLTLPENSGFQVEMDNASGRFHSDFATNKNGKHYSYGDGSCKIEISGVSGDVTIHKAAS